MIRTTGPARQSAIRAKRRLVALWMVSVVSFEFIFARPRSVICATIVVSINKSIAMAITAHDGKP